jgi:hypothetical protein
MSWSVLGIRSKILSRTGWPSVMEYPQAVGSQGNVQNVVNHLKNWTGSGWSSP